MTANTSDNYVDDYQSVDATTTLTNPASLFDDTSKTCRLDTVSSQLAGISTPVTIGSFIVIAITGMLMFFHFELGIIKLANEWIGWIFLIAALIHGFLLHQKSFKQHLKQKLSAGLIAAGVMITLMTAIIPLEQQGTPAFLRAEVALFTADLEKSAAVLELTKEQLVTLLTSQGLVVADSDTSLQKIAEKNQMDRKNVMGLLLQ